MGPSMAHQNSQSGLAGQSSCGNLMMIGGYHGSQQQFPNVVVQGQTFKDPKRTLMD